MLALRAELSNQSRPPVPAAMLKESFEDLASSHKLAKEAKAHH